MAFLKSFTALEGLTYSLVSSKDSQTAVREKSIRWLLLNLPWQRRCVQGCQLPAKAPILQDIILLHTVVSSTSLETREHKIYISRFIGCKMCLMAFFIRSYPQLVLSLHFQILSYIRNPAVFCLRTFGTRVSLFMLQTAPKSTPRMRRLGPELKFGPKMMRRPK